MSALNNLSGSFDLLNELTIHNVCGMYVFDKARDKAQDAIHVIPNSQAIVFVTRDVIPDTLILTINECCTKWQAGWDAIDENSYIDDVVDTLGLSYVDSLLSNTYEVIWTLLCREQYPSKDIPRVDVIKLEKNDYNCYTLWLKGGNVDANILQEYCKFWIVGSWVTINRNKFKV